MKFISYCLVILVGLFVLSGCDVEPKEENAKKSFIKKEYKKGDFITGSGRDFSVTEGFPDAPAPAKKSGKNSQ